VGGGRRGLRAVVPPLGERVVQQLADLVQLVFRQPTLGLEDQQRVRSEVLAQEAVVAGELGYGGGKRRELGLGEGGAKGAVVRGDRHGGSLTRSPTSVRETSAILRSCRTSTIGYSVRPRSIGPESLAVATKISSRSRSSTRASCSKG